VEGAHQTLEQLSEHYRLFVATNAEASTAAQVAAALNRVDLGTHIEQVFTMNETRARKPEPQYYHALSKLTGFSAEACLMVGDDPINDITGAQEAGWKTAWLNPAYAPWPNLLPRHDFELYRLIDLPLRLAEDPLPTFSQSMRWLVKNGASFHLIQHVQSVAAVAYRMALWMRANGHIVNPLLAHRGGLLHDVAKLHPDREPEEIIDHGRKGFQLLNHYGYTQVALLADRHMLFHLKHAERGPQTWEEKLVHFADKIIEGSQVVSIEARLSSLRQRYHINQENLQAIHPALVELQAELCDAAGIQPFELVEKLKAAFMDRS
jgi:putative hydrolase of the HAD superfamily